MPETSSPLHAAIDRYARKHREDPQGRFFLPLATAYRRLGELERAEALLRGGLEQHPEYLSAHVDLGLTLAARGAAQEAKATFRHVLASDPHNLVALRSLAELAAEAGDLPGAEHWYGELAAADPLSDEVSRGLAEVRASSRTAREDERAVEADGDREARSSGSAAGPELQALPEPPAEEPAGEAVGLQSAVPEELASETLAELYARQGFTEEAAEMYRALIRRRGEQPPLLRRLAELQGEPAAGAEREGWRPGDAAAPSTDAEVPPSADGMDAFAASFRYGFTGQGAPAPAVVAGGGGDGQQGEAVERTGPAAPSIAGYFGELLGWRPQPRAWPGRTAHPDAAEPAPPDARAAEEELASFRGWLRGLEQ